LGRFQSTASCQCSSAHAAEIVEQQIQHTHVTIVNELNQFLNEQEEHDAMHHNSTEMDKISHPASDGGKNHDLHKEKEM